MDMDKTEQLRKYKCTGVVGAIQEDFQNGLNKRMNYVFDDLFKRVEKIIDEPLKIAILGEFSAGKSSFINSARTESRFSAQNLAVYWSQKNTVCWLLVPPVHVSG